MQGRQTPGGVDFWVQQQLRRVESSADLQRANVARAHRLADVVRLANLTVPPELRYMKNSIPGVRRLRSAIETRLETLIKARLETISAAATPEDALQERGRFMLECDVLRGEFAQQYRFADTESQRRVHERKSAAPLPAGDTPT